MMAGLILSGCSSESEETASDGYLYLDALTKTVDSTGVTGETTTVERRDINLSYTFTASRVYPVEENITYVNEYASEIVFGEYMVEEEDFVKEGQELFVLHQYMDEIDAEEASLTYARENASYESQCESYEERLADLTEGTEEYIYLEYEYANYKKNMEAELSALQEEIEAYDYIRENPDIYITAPFDGYVSYVLDVYEDEEIAEGATLITLQDTTNWYYTLADTAESIPVGKEVTLYDDGWDDGVLTLTGTVACADMALESSETKGYAIVTIDSIKVGDEDVTDSFSSTDLPKILDVQMYQMELKSVLAVPVSYLYTSSDQYYVYLLQDDKQIKTYVKCLNSSIGGYAWIISGLEEGDVLVKAN